MPDDLIIIRRPVWTGPKATHPLELGDVIWRRPSDQGSPFFGPYSENLPSQAEWLAAKNAHLAQLRQQPGVSPALIRLVEATAFPAFVLEEEGAEAITDGEGPARALGAGSDGLSVGGLAQINVLGFYIGHPAIIARTGSDPMVIDAVLSNGGVKLRRLQVWLDEMSDASVWHGRLRGFDAPQRARIAEVAFSVLDRPYSLWSLDLADDQSFYCSKLIWWAIHAAHGVAIDDEPGFPRSLLLTPKQSANSRHFERLFWPWPY